MADTRRIRRDGKDWDYTPGSNSTYIAVQKDQPTPDSYVQPSQPAKVINSPLTNEGSDPMSTWSILNKRKSKIIPGNTGTTPVASSRG